MHKKKEERNNAYDFTCIHVQLMQAQVILCWLKLTLPVHLHVLSSHKIISLPLHILEAMLIDISNTGFQILHNGAISNNHLTLPLCTLLHIRPPHFPQPPSQTSPSLAQVLAWSHNPYPATTLSIFAPHYPRASKKTFCLLSGVQESALTR